MCRERNSCSLEDSLPEDHGGHLIGHQFGGSGLIDNLVPMNGRVVNQSSYKKLENEWKTVLADNGEVYVKVSPVYEGESLRPVKFELEYWTNGTYNEVILRNP